MIRAMYAFVALASVFSAPLLFAAEVLGEEIGVDVAPDGSFSIQDVQNSTAIATSASAMWLVVGRNNLMVGDDSRWEAVQPATMEEGFLVEVWENAKDNLRLSRRWKVIPGRDGEALSVEVQLSNTGQNPVTTDLLTSLEWGMFEDPSVSVQTIEGATDYGSETNLEGAAVPSRLSVHTANSNFYASVHVPGLATMPESLVMASAKDLKNPTQYRSNAISSRDTFTYQDGLISAYTLLKAHELQPEEDQSFTLLFTTGSWDTNLNWATEASDSAETAVASTNVQPAETVAAGPSSESTYITNGTTVIVLPPGISAITNTLTQIQLGESTKLEADIADVNRMLRTVDTQYQYLLDLYRSRRFDALPETWNMEYLELQMQRVGAPLAPAQTFPTTPTVTAPSTENAGSTTATSPVDTAATTNAATTAGEPEADAAATDDPFQLGI